MIYEKQKLKDILNKSIEHSKNGYVRYLKSLKDYDSIYESILHYTKCLAKDKQLKTRIYWIIHDLTEYPRCLNENCNASLSGKEIRSIDYGFPHHCCQQCAKDSSIRKQKYESTCEKKYGAGITNASQADEVKRKKELTCMDHFGVTNPMKADVVKATVKDTSLRVYGTECPLQNEDIHALSVQTCLDKYGVTSYSKTKEYTVKVTTTNLKNFGVDYPNQDHDFRCKSQQRYTYNDMQFDSKAEIAFFIFNIDNNNDIERDPYISFPYYPKEGMVKYYFPDFRVGDLLVEIKGLQFFEDRDPTKQMIDPYDRSQDYVYEAKHQCMLKNNVLILTDKDCNVYIRYVKSKYGKDFFDNLKNNKKGN